MALGSGLAASLNIARETTFGVAVPAGRSLEFVSESLVSERVTTDSSSIRAGRQVASAGRRKISNVSAGGDIELEFGSRGHGILLEALMGVSVAANGTITRPAPVLVTGGTTARRTTWTLGELADSFTIQKAVPRTDGVIVPMTFAGARCTGAEFSVSVGELLSATFSWDAVQALLAGDAPTTATALQPTAYAADSGGFTFREGNLLVKAKGAADTTFTTAAAIREATISVETPVAADRYFLGGGGLKAAQLQNGLRTIGGSLGAEFINNDFLTNYMGDVEFGIRLQFLGNVIEGSIREELTFTLPAVFLDGGLPTVGGVDLVEFSGDFTALAPTDGTSALTISTVNADTAV